MPSILSLSAPVRASTRVLLLTGALAFAHGAHAAVIPVTNAGFENTAGLPASGEFNFGQPFGWDFYDPAMIVQGGTGANGIYTGMLQPNGVDFFNSTAPEGLRVAILFGFGNTASAGAGEYGIQQTLAGNVLEANTQYELSVQVGNIASGTTFNLSGFPGYRVELLAGDTILAHDDNSLTIPEAEFDKSTVSFTTGALHALLGQDLGIRLVNLNTQALAEDIEVDFDDVRLTATSTTTAPATVSEPASLMLLLLGLAAAARQRGRGS